MTQERFAEWRTEPHSGFWIVAMETYILETLASIA